MNSILEYPVIHVTKVPGSAFAAGGKSNFERAIREW
jgi:hypothetical protein